MLERLLKVRCVVGWERSSHTFFWSGNTFPHLLALITIFEAPGAA